VTRATPMNIYEGTPASFQALFNTTEPSLLRSSKPERKIQG